MPGGSHPGFGTRNSLIALDNGTYFEVIAPDPTQELAGNRGGRIAAQNRPGLMTFAVRADDLTKLRESAGRVGLAVQGPTAMHRSRQDGTRLDWSILYLAHDTYGEAVPFVIDWGKTPHPSQSTPQGCRLKNFIVLHPDPEPLARLFGDLGVPVRVGRGAHPGFLAILDTPKGEVTLTDP
jgi:Glyoxalase-like domain